MVTLRRRMAPEPLGGSFTMTPSIYAVAVLAIGLLTLVSMWLLFAKAGEAGWKSLVPIYSALVLLRLVGRPWWWLLLYLVPIVNIIPAVMTCFDIAKAYGKGRGTGFGLLLLGPFFIMWLAFGDATYTPPSRTEPAAMRRAA